MNYLPIMYTTIDDYGRSHTVLVKELGSSLELDTVENIDEVIREEFETSKKVENENGKEYRISDCHTVLNGKYVGFWQNADSTWRLDY